MRSRWEVMKQYAGGEYYWRVYRIRNLDQPDHSGNREIIDTIFDTKEQAQRKAGELNACSQEDKAAITKELGELLKKTELFGDLQDICYKDGVDEKGEFVYATFPDKRPIRIFVTGDSGVALIRDTIAYLQMAKWEEERG